ncbi:hypothetical protein DH2020_011073 [Rehmannia glutinosa]|uniref:GTP cyclohydrolase II n=1 Tax=Rehmannia glutinosa TaxID=99300 RepID=A0ABR0XCB6_REHGL
MASINFSCSSTSLARSRLFNLPYGNTQHVNGIESFKQPSAKVGLSIKASGKIKSALFSEENDLRHHSAGSNGAISSVIGDVSGGVEVQSDSVVLGALAADMAPTTSGFPVENDEFDLDLPSEGFSCISEAIEDIRKGKMVVVVDDEDRENEGDLIMAASKVTPEAMAFFVKHGTGIVCVSMKEEDLERLQIPLMVNHRENEEKLSTAFTVSVVRDGGVLKRAGHTEAAVDLAMLAGLGPAGVLCEIVDDDGSMARLPKLLAICTARKLENCIYCRSNKVVEQVLLVNFVLPAFPIYRRKRDRLVEHASAARIPTMWGPFIAYCYRSTLEGIEHIAMVKGDIGDGQDILVRVHSECLTGDIFGSARCDCGNQLALAMQQIEAAGRGVLVYLRGHEGRGIGLGHKLRAYNLQDDGRDTVEANEELGLPVDSREYGIGAQILRDLGVRTMKLMTNNPAKYIGLKGYGLAVSGRVPLVTPITKDNMRYLETKRAKMGHHHRRRLSLHHRVPVHQRLPEINFAEALSISEPYPAPTPSTAPSPASSAPSPSPAAPSPASSSPAPSPAAVLSPPSPPPSGISPSPSVAFPPAADGVAPAPHRNGAVLNRAGLAAAALGFFAVALVA